MKEYVEQGIEDDEALSSDSLSYEEDVENVVSEEESVPEEESAPEELTAIDSEEGEIEEGIEVPDEEVIEPEFVQNAQEEVIQDSGSELSQTSENDYNEQFAQILESLNSLQGDVSLDDVNENLISIDANMEQLHKDMVAYDRNFKFHSRLEIGLLVAVWGSLIIYFAFSKLL